MSNSAMLSLLTRGEGGEPAALSAQRPAAEREADRLSAGVTATSPGQLKAEMGRRLNADFSSVRFHFDAASVQRGDRLGARAWTQGADVYFGAGGFDRTVAAHELVHTVQQGAVAGSVGESAPAGTVQMMPNPFKWIRNSFKSWRARRAKAKQAAKRPWEMTKENLQANRFNPGGVDEITAVHAELDQAKTPAEAYRIFGRFAGNDEAQLLAEDQQTSWNRQDVDMDRFRNRLKNMARMVHDYPELKGMIGDMSEYHKKGASMAASPTLGGSERSNLLYNPIIDSTTDSRRLDGSYDKSALDLTGTDLSYSGNHELGHVLNTLLPPSQTDQQLDFAEDDWHYSILSDALLKKVLGTRGVLSRQQRKGLKYHQKDDEEAGHLKNQVDLEASGLAEKGVTSRYGQTDANEFFAEAFADVYAHGTDARKASIELVKNYERLMKQKRAGERMTI